MYWKYGFIQLIYNHQKTRASTRKESTAEEIGRHHRWGKTKTCDEQPTIICLKKWISVCIIKSGLSYPGSGHCWPFQREKPCYAYATIILISCTPIITTYNKNNNYYCYLLTLDWDNCHPKGWIYMGPQRPNRDLNNQVTQQQHFCKN